MTSMHFYAWKKGLKTGQYYLRTRPKASPAAFVVNNDDDDNDDGSVDRAAPARGCLHIVRCCMHTYDTRHQGREERKRGRSYQ